VASHQKAVAERDIRSGEIVHGPAARFELHVLDARQQKHAPEQIGEQCSQHKRPQRDARCNAFGGQAYRDVSDKHSVRPNHISRGMPAGRIIRKSGSVRPRIDLSDVNLAIHSTGAPVNNPVSSAPRLSASTRPKAVNISAPNAVLKSYGYSPSNAEYARFKSCLLGAQACAGHPR
jgi:hypothetical protein